MASFHIHLAIAKRYIEKNNVEDEKSFYNGTIEPDLEEYENILHYTDKNRNKENIFQYLKGKALLPNFLTENDINNDYYRGVFLHLVTDYLFFNDFFETNYLATISYNDFVKDLYYSYNLVNQYLRDKYSIDLSDLKDKLYNNIKKDRKEKGTIESKGKNILDINKLDNFIERVSSINLEEYKLKLLKNGINILPD